MVFLATVDGEVEHVRHTLIARLDALLAQDAHLSSRVIDCTTPTPSFAPREKALLAEQVVVVADAKSLPSNNDLEETNSAILKQELCTLESIQLDRDALLRVTIYAGSPGSCGVALCTSR